MMTTYSNEMRAATGWIGYVTTDEWIAWVGVDGDFLKFAWTDL